MISDFCRNRVAIVLSPLETEAMRQYLTKLLKLGISPAMLMGLKYFVRRCNHNTGNGKESVL
jgi:hypothetical protein